MRIRHATIEDIDALRAMTSEYLKEAHDGGSPVKPGERSIAWYLGIYAALIGGGTPGAILIAEEGEEPLGFTFFYVEPIRIDHEFQRAARSVVTYVRAPHRRTGVGSELISEKEKTARRAFGCDVISAGIRLSSDAGLAIARASGYVPHEVAHVKPLKMEPSGGA